MGRALGCSCSLQERRAEFNSQSVHQTRLSFNGRMQVCQSCNEGSIPFDRSNFAYSPVAQWLERVAHTICSILRGTIE